MSSQLSHSSTPFNAKIFDIMVICDGIESPANVGSLFRICEAMGVRKIIFCNNTVNFSSNRLRRTARDTEKKVDYILSEDIVLEINKLKELQYQAIALEITSDSIPLNQLHPESKKIALVIGNEKNGISPIVLQQMSLTTHIEMYGKNSSMNVIQATSIALFALTKL